MRIQLVKYKDGYLGVSVKSFSEAERLHVGTYAYETSGVIGKYTRYGVGGFAYLESENPQHYKCGNCFEILFTTPDLELEGVPLIELNIDEVNKLAVEFAESVNNTDRDKAFVVAGYQGGYNKAKELYKFTEDDVRKAIELGRFGGKIRTYYEPNEIIEQLSKPKEPIAVDVEHERQRIPVGDDGWKDLYFPKTQTTNGKEYCIITKIYYE